MKSPGLFYAYSEKSEGNMSFHWGEHGDVAQNREAFFETVGADPERVVGMRLQHGTEMILVTEAACGVESLDVDCLITKTKNVYLTVLTGDCLPVIFYEPEQKLLALAHISRANAAMHFAGKIAERMALEGANREKILVWIGPGVRKESYILDLPEGRVAFDLPGRVVEQLSAAGIGRSNIEISSDDTISDEHFFSHYRAKRTGEAEGRMITVAALL